MWLREPIMEICGGPDVVNLTSALRFVLDLRPLARYCAHSQTKCQAVMLRRPCARFGATSHARRRRSARMKHRNCNFLPLIACNAKATAVPPDNDGLLPWPRGVSCERSAIGQASVHRLKKASLPIGLVARALSFAVMQLTIADGRVCPS